MKIKLNVCAFVALLSLFVSGLNAQTQHQVGQITVINLGDGRFLHREREGETPLNGQHRLIDGRRSEYILAEFKDGLYDGTYQSFKYDVLAEEGVYKEGRRVGEFKEYQYNSTIDNQAIKELKHYKNGKPDGLWITYFNDGKPEREKGYKEGKEHGPERIYLKETGELVTEMNYADGKKEGKQRQFMRSNSGDYVVKSNYKNGLREGAYSETFAESGGVIKKGAYKNGKQEGKWSFNRKNGLPEKEVTYTAGTPDGETRIFFTDGTLSKVENYKNGKKYGLFQNYQFDTGSLKSQYEYVDGKKHGKFVTYYDKDQKHKEGRYENDREVYTKVYNRRGEVESVTDRTQK